jgi:hypothetical protein
MGNCSQRPKILLYEGFLYHGFFVFIGNKKHNDLDKEPNSWFYSFCWIVEESWCPGLILGKWTSYSPQVLENPS